MCSVIQPLGDWTARGGSTGFVQWCRPPRLKQLPPADPLCRSRSRPRGGLEHGVGPADRQHSPIGLMCRIYGAVRFQIRGGARPALVTEADVRAVTEIVSALSDRRQGRAASSAPPVDRSSSARSPRPSPWAGDSSPSHCYSAGCPHRSRCRSQTVQHFSGYRHRCSTLMCGSRGTSARLVTHGRARRCGAGAGSGCAWFLLDVAKTPGVPASGVQVFIFSWMVPHADVIRSARLVIVGRSVPFSPAGTSRPLLIITSQKSCRILAAPDPANDQSSPSRSR